MSETAQIPEQNPAYTPSPNRPRAGRLLTSLALAAAITAGTAACSSDTDPLAGPPAGTELSAPPDVNYDNRDNIDRTAEALPSPSSPADIILVDPGKQIVVQKPESSPQAAKKSPANTPAKPPVKPPAAQAPKAPAHVSPEVQAGHVDKILSNRTANEFIAANSARLGFGSASLIRSPNGTPIGATTAEHLGYQPRDSTRYYGTDGRIYAVRADGPRELKVGHTGGSRVGKIDRAFLPPVGNTDNDTVIAMLEGQSDAAVLEAYSRDRLTPQRIKALPRGTTVFASGYPVAIGPQGDHLKSDELKVVGTKPTPVGDSETSKTVEMLFATSEEADPAKQLLSGASGGKGFIIENGELQSVGIISIAVDLSDTPQGRQNRQDYQQRLGADFGNAKSLIGFAFEASIELQLVHYVNSPTMIPGGTDKPVVAQPNTGVAQ